MSKLHVHATEAWVQRGRPTYRATETSREKELRAGLDGAIEEGFRRTEESFANMAQQKDWDAGSTGHTHAHSHCVSVPSSLCVSVSALTLAASTALVCLVHGRDPPTDPAAKVAAEKERSTEKDKGQLSIVTANLGDCRAVLCREVRSLPFSHRPSLPLSLCVVRARACVCCLSRPPFSAQCPAADRGRQCVCQRTTNPTAATRR